MSESRSKEYIAYHNMKRRARPTSESDIRRFGGSIWDGIEVEPDFLAKDGYSAFLEEVGRAPGPEYLLDRKNNTKGYIRGNLKWSTPSESALNKNSADMMTAFGKTQNMASWCKEYDITPSLLYQRVHKLGWSVEDALTSPKYSRYGRLFKE